MNKNVFLYVILLYVIPLLSKIFSLDSSELIDNDSECIQMPF